MNEQHNYTTSFTVDQTPEHVFNAVNNVRGWWTGDPGAEGDTSTLGSEFTFRHKDIHYSKQKITEMIPGKRIVWHVIEAHLTSGKDPEEWVSTDIVFDITPQQDGKTELRFTHVGLVPELPCYGSCSDAWSYYLHTTLPALIASENK